MESVDLMGRDGVWISTPGKSIPAMYEATLASKQRTGKESVNKPFPCIDSLDILKDMDDVDINKLPASIIDDGHEAVLHVAENDGPKPTEVVECDTSSVQEEAAKVSLCESQVGFDSIPTPSKSNNSRKRRNDDNDLNKKPSQRHRVKKHRPKIFDDSKPKKVAKAQTPKCSTPKPKTPKPATPNRVQERRKSSRKNKSTSSTSYGHGDVTPTVQEASTVSVIDVKSCKRFLDFEGLLEYSNGQQQREDIYVSKNQEQAGKECKRYGCVYQRRKNIKLKASSHTPTMLVYRRTFRKNNCLQNSRKIRPCFPKMFKKRRMLRKKVCIWKNQCFENPLEDTESNLRRSLRRCVQTTREKVQNMASKPEDKKGDVGKHNHEIKGWFSRRNRSVRHTCARAINGFSVSESMRNDNEAYLLCDERFLSVTECLPLNEIPDDSVDNLNCSRLLEVEVLESQSLVPRPEEVLCTKEDYNRYYVEVSMRNLIKKIAGLDINAPCKELAVRDQNVDVELMKIVPSKKRKVVPKVNLDKESLRVWKVLMENDGSEPVEETDKDKEEWWEKQREMFRRRVDSFIAKMHLIQGDRRFSPWKGSVTDSVVGVYLTQNVTDHLSSSAFMSVAARFPAKSRTKEIVDHGEVAFRQELVTSYNFMTEGLFTRNETKRNTSTSCVDVTDATPITERNSNISCADASNMTPSPAHDNPCVDGNFDNFRKRIEVEEDDFLKQFCKFDIDGSPPNESRVNRDLCTSKIEREEQSAISFDFAIPSESAGQQKSTREKEPEVVNPIDSVRSDVTEGVNAVNNHRRVKKKPLETESGGKKNNKFGKKQEKKTNWEDVRKTYCKTGSVETDDNYVDVVDWDAVRRGTVEELASIIIKRGMNNVLAGKIKDFLDRMYKDHGTLDLEWLRDVPPDMAKEFLLSIEGIGLKSVECIRLLTLHHHAFPVDTNVGRVATRLGWVPLLPLPDGIQIHLLNAYPMVDTIQKYLYPRLCTLDQRTLYELHYQLITFGKVFCTKIKPNCNACPMRAECRHYASAVASGRLALHGPVEVSNVTSIVPVESEPNRSMFSTQTSRFDGSNSGSSYHVQTCDPIIEVPLSPEPEINDTQQDTGDIEDYYVESGDDEIPTVQLNIEEFKETLSDTIDTHNISLPEGDKWKALVVLSAEANTFRVPQMKFIARLRTFHLVYELPDSHPILSGFDEREDDDPSPYLLRVWHPDELPKPLENTEDRACINDQEETLKGTILIPCRTANRGKFPLNGTYFQVNEVFADDETSHFPIDVPSHLLWNLTTRTLGCGSSATSIFRGLSTAVIQRMFWRGSICVRSFNRKTRQPDTLHKRLYMSTTVLAAENKKRRDNAESHL